MPRSPFERVIGRRGASRLGFFLFCTLSSRSSGMSFRDRGVFLLWRRGEVNGGEGGSLRKSRLAWYARVQCGDARWLGDGHVSNILSLFSSIDSSSESHPESLLYIRQCRAHSSSCLLVASPNDMYGWRVGSVG